MNYKLDTDTHVFFYEQDFYVLSNFSSFTIERDRILFPTSEHAYHYYKFVESAPHLARAIVDLRSAHDAFKFAELNKQFRRPDWDVVKESIMKSILLDKVSQHSYVKYKLLQTGDRILVEDSWRDGVWGWGADKQGQNLLGKIWMEIRSELKSA